MTIGIIGAMDPEIEHLTKDLRDIHKQTIGFAEFISGKLADRDVVIVRCGIGKVSAGAVTALLISHYNVTCVINTGSAGGIGHGLKVGDTVFSTKVAYHDADLTVFGYKRGQMAAHPLYFDADAQLISLAEEAALSLTDFKGAIKKGVVLSGDQFISDPDKKLSLVETFPEALVVEMEGAAIAQICNDFCVPFLVIRAVSDCAEEGNAMTYEEFLPLASQNSAKLVLALVARL
ncbi:MAG: 5'-methylthioadenosine/adenosylhomocysteine nucleosidase [Succinivibrio sp.]|nr:5'-methylthioadenosine/adenosylhomocysteine nucleosidase [Succinivibrio sp.]